MNGLRPSRKYLSIVGLAGASTGLYAHKIDYRCSRYAAYSSTDSCWCWKTYLNWLKMLLAKAQLSPWFFWKKSLNSSSVIGSSASELAWSWLYSWLLTNDSRANLLALYRSSFLYLPGGLEMEAGVKVWAGTGVGARETAGIGSKVPLLLVRALPALWRVRGPAIWTGWVDYTSVLPNRLADLLNLELLKL